MSSRTRSSRQQHERFFALYLPAFITGTDDRGRMFHEETRISSINAFEVRCGLKTRVPVGAAIRLSVDVPGTLFLGPPLKLILAGEVAASQNRKGEGAGRTVFIKLFSRFRLHPKDIDGKTDAPFSASAD